MSSSGTYSNANIVYEQPIQFNQVNSFNTQSNITTPHTILFCEPIPTEHFNCTAPGAIPPMTDCGVYVRDLKQFPLNNIPSGGICSNDNRISSSEMCLGYIRLDNYPVVEGNITQQWVNKDTGIIFATYTHAIYTPEPGSTNWWQFVWSYVGHFSHEINTVGNYQYIITTPWGTSTTDFEVVDNTCTPDWNVGVWGECINNVQNRTVIDNNNCGITTNKPPESQLCLSNQNSDIITIGVISVGIIAIKSIYDLISNKK